MWHVVGKSSVFFSSDTVEYLPERRGRNSKLIFNSKQPQPPYWFGYVGKGNPMDSVSADCVHQSGLFFLIGRPSNVKFPRWINFSFESILGLVLFYYTEYKSNV